MTLRGDGLAWRGSACNGGGRRPLPPSGDVGKSLLSSLHFVCAGESPYLALYLLGRAEGVGWGVQDVKSQARGAHRMLVSS